MGILTVLCAYLRNDLRAVLGDRIGTCDADCTIPDDAPDASISQRAASALLRSIPKKFQGEIDHELADTAAVVAFLGACEHAENWQFPTESLGPRDDEILGEFKQILWNFFNPHGMPLLTQASIEAHVDFGPGNASGAETTAFLEKIGLSRLSASNQLVIDFFDQWVTCHPTRVNCEIARSLSFGSPFVAEPMQIVPVPKKREISRLVKTEPLLNMFFQKGVQFVLEERLRDFFHIDLRDQPSLNAELAQLGSMFGEYCTIDLKQASDFISMELCRRYLPKGAMTWLSIFRSELAIVKSPSAAFSEEYKWDENGEVIDLPMMATMGNAFCFPLQTIIFASVVKAVYNVMGIPWIVNGFVTDRSRFSPQPKDGQSYWSEVNGYIDGFPTAPTRTTMACVADESKDWSCVWTERSAGNWGVFGDDIVCVADAYESILRILTHLGSVPNRDKSYGPNDGPFRESCGADFYDGHNIRGVYLKNLVTPQDYYVLINNLVDWSARQKILLPSTIAWLMSQVERVEIPPFENPDAGIRVPLDCVQTAHVFRSYRVPKDERRPNYQGSYLYKRYLPVQGTVDVASAPDLGYLVPDDESLGSADPFWGVNPSAILLSAVKGVLQGGRVSFRLRKTSYRLKVGVAPCWDYIDIYDRTRSDEDNQSWYKTARAYFGEV